MRAFLLLLLVVPRLQDLTGAEPSRRIVLDAASDAERVLPLRAAAAGELFVRASSASCDPRLELALLGDDGAREPLSDDDSGGGTTAFLSLAVESGRALELRAFAASPDARGAIVVELSLATESDTSVRLAEDVLAELAALDLAAADAPSRIEALVRRLPAEPAAISPAIRAAAERFVALPRRVRTVGTELAARRALFAWAERHLPPTHRERLDAAAFLAAAAKGAGRLDEARALELAILETRRALASDDDRAVQIARLNLAATLYMLGDLEHAVAEFRALEASATRTLAAADPLRLAAQQNLAAVELELGYARAAATLYEEVSDVLQTAGARDDLQLARLRTNQARALLALGAPEEALAVAGEALERMLPLLPSGDPELHAVELVRAAALAELGDLRAARVLHERVLEQQLAVLPPDSLELATTRQGLAALCYELGDPAAARALYEAVVATRARVLAADHPQLLLARLYLAQCRNELGERDEALADFEAIVAALPAELSPAHPLVRAARTSLATALSERGELGDALPLQEAVLASLAAERPATDPDLQRARNNLAWIRIREDRLDATAELVRSSSDAIAERLAHFAPRSSPREIETVVSRSRDDLDEALSLAAEMPIGEARSALEARLFELIESVRTVGLRQRRAQRLLESVSDDLLVQEASDVVDVAEAEVVRRARAGGEELYAALRRRDAAQRALQELLSTRPEQAGARPAPDVGALAASLAADEAAVGFWRYERTGVERESGTLSMRAPHYLAFVLRPSGLARVELGPARAIEAAVERWRVEVLRGIPRGMAPHEASAGGDALEAEERAGAALRALAFDPLRTALGEARTIRAAPDDALFLVPFDALPDGPEAVLGDSWCFLGCTALADLGRTSARPASGSLLALGGIEYDDAPSVLAAQEPEDVRIAARAAAPVSPRGPAWEPGFAFLPESESEVRALAHSFERAFPDAPEAVLTGAEASREAFERLAPEARFLHLATHAWFAPESIPSTRDTAAASRGALIALDAREQVRGFAPLLLCGLAFAGANEPASPAGERAGLLTAEELAGLDLSRCELAVLSACETNVGLRRAGQGVASLQSALHAAGVRTSVASLWRVSDAATRELMQQFYRGLWLEGRDAADALWQAKLALRRQLDADERPRYATRDWAAWVLAGTP